MIMSCTPGLEVPIGYWLQPTEMCDCRVLLGVLHGVSQEELPIHTTRCNSFCRSQLHLAKSLLWKGLRSEQILVHYCLQASNEHCHATKPLPAVQF